MNDVIIISGSFAGMAADVAALGTHASEGESYDHHHG
jgi:hypothetical protein